MATYGAEKKRQSRARKRKAAQADWNPPKRPPRHRVNRDVEAAPPRTPIKTCEECGGQPWRRPASGCGACGQPFGEERQVRGRNLLSSSASQALVWASQ